MLSPARARSAGGTAVRSRPSKWMVPASGESAPAMHFISVLLPEPLGPMRPWICERSTARSTPSRARSWPKRLATPAASRRATRPSYRSPAGARPKRPTRSRSGTRRPHSPVGRKTTTARSKSPSRMGQMPGYRSASTKLA